MAAAPQLEFGTPAACPNRDAWVREVLARLEPAPEVQSRQRLDELVATVQVTPSGTHASIVFRVPGGAERVVTGRDCAEVLSAAALIAAIAVGSVSAATPPSSDAERASSEGPSPPDIAARGGLRSALPAAPGGRALEQTPAFEPPAPVLAPAHASALEVLDEAEPEPVRQGRRWAIAFGAGAAANNWLGQSPFALFDVFVDLLPAARGGSARLAGSMGLARATVDGRSADFDFWGGELALCPGSFGSRWSWQWTNCAQLRIGRLRAAGDSRSTLQTGRERSFVWVDLGAVTRLLTPPVGGVRFEAELGLQAPFWRREFRFEEPDAHLVETPTIGATGGVAVLIPLDARQPTD